ncbi:diaminopimelate epimerase [Leadbetterella byssophila DSM 17132]|uniref:Diaminopimelate epimerase n=1 Tax=Leadbetterella byssophila (strain DSM 17132 / JCM 16389 / KACC 11308 / NBRC 106382 / 4M15) TaxID=649349 RepID=E4RXW1_LEAB4|nr:diaminopimelate epimerase [Leadbetterella byssophila]ADQ19058.1 diaminopimelate epimerase [Leadbetterella byssophila DSM 17132]
MKFYKYQGTGNDFVMIDNRSNTFQGDVAALCHRRFGIGADGLILIEKEEGYDFRMRYFNADGAEGSMCGNGGRCAVQFASDLGIFEGKTSFIAVDGPHEAEITDKKVSLKMIDVHPLEEVPEGYFLNTGSPHLIIFTENVDAIDVSTEGAKIRYNEYWMAKGGVNVNYVQVLSPSSIKVRTYERGVEDETYSCGTGVTAASIISHFIKGVSTRVEVETLGGNLEVQFDPGSLITKVLLTGPAQKVFEGEL